MTKKLTLIGTVFGIAVASGFAATRAIQPAPSATFDGRMPAGSLSRPLSVCDVAGDIDHIIRGRVIDWKIVGTKYFKKAGGELDLSEVTVEVFETLKGSLSGTARLGVTVRVLPERGDFEEGTLTRGAEAYFAVRDVEGVSLIATRGYWPIVSNGNVEAEGKQIDQQLFRAQISGLVPCANSDPK